MQLTAKTRNQCWITTMHLNELWATYRSRWLNWEYVCDKPYDSELSTEESEKAYPGILIIYNTSKRNITFRMVNHVLVLLFCWFNILLMYSQTTCSDSNPWNKFLHICASCFGQQKVQSLCFFPTHNTKTTSPNCKIPLGACFINTSHSSTGLPTEDYGELLECHLCFPDQRGASTVAKHGEQRDQPRLDTCIPNTRGWCPVRKQAKLSCLVQEQRRGR